MKSINALTPPGLFSQHNTTEQKLEELLKQNKVLLHGSTENIQDQNLTPTGRDLYATDDARIALLKALISNREATLKYPYKIHEHNPLTVTIEHIQEHTLREKGFVYVVPKKGFKKNKHSTWEYASTKETPILAKIEVQKEDFTHPIYDSDHKKRIQ